MLNGKELIERGVITGTILEDNIQQHGIDLNLIKVEKLDFTLGNRGLIPAEGKTQLCDRVEVELIDDKWHLMQGVYDITLAQGCNIPADMMLLIRQRSSLLRNGAILHSSVFDAGFKTDKIGTILHVHQPIIIERRARVAQIYGHACTPVENLYDGQWQNDKQRVAE